MTPKIEMNSRSTLPIKEVYEEFVFSRKVQGCTDATVQNYKDRLRNVSKHLDVGIVICSSVFQIIQISSCVFPNNRV